ncbi:hypothetical protein CSC2_02720 [Clostridium zeae]|uniref:DUF624 domain-containing protein n=1 Tax=Clostridium zeae TaxID=2759022 RepID=A0ABQ1E4S8_9CLOT|nr:DUF624 domain-containing protein [Clostridium zeae]GFZ29746.1 hypothetical protein CSC2_02720 [Clostridium zeae]
MANNNDFGDSNLSKVLNYVHWFFITNIYFFLCNILFIICAYTIEIKFDNILVFLIALIPTGPSITAVCSSMGKIVREKYLDTTKDFFRAYKDNFFPSMKLWILFLLTTFILLLDIKLCFMNKSFLFLLIPTVVILFLLILIFSYAFPLLSRFSMKTIDIIKLSVYLSLKNPFISLINIAVLIVSTLLFFQGRGIIGLFLGSLAAYGIVFNMRKIFDYVEKKFISP